MKLPNPGRAVVDIAKLRDYVLSASHVRGRHKARVFASALGLNVLHVEMLRNSLLEACEDGHAAETERDVYGVRYVLDFPLTGPSGTATIRSAWIVRVGEDFPRFTTCYVL